MYDKAILVKQKEIDWSVFNYGIHIHEKLLPPIEDAISKKLRKGDYVPVQVRFLGQNYNCHIECLNTGAKSMVVHLIWDKKENSPIAKRLQSFYPDLYHFLLEYKKLHPQEKYITVPEKLQKKLYLKTIPNVSTLFLDTKLTWDNPSVVKENDEDNINVIEIPSDLKTALQEQIEIFSNMKRASKGGLKTPHKPVLIIAIITMFEKFNLNMNMIMLDKYLKGIFNDVWEYYVKRKDLFSCNPNLPFHHIDANIGTVDDMFSPPHMTFTDSLFELLQNPAAREIMKRHLITMIN